MTRPQWQSNIVEAYQRLNESQQAAGERFIQTMQRTGDNLAKLGKEAYEVMKDYNKTILEKRQKAATSEFVKGMTTAKTQAERAAFMSTFDMTDVDPQLAAQTFVQMKNVDHMDRQYLLELDKFKEEKITHVKDEMYKQVSLWLNHYDSEASESMKLAGSIAESMIKAGKSPAEISRFISNQHNIIKSKKDAAVSQLLKVASFNPEGDRNDSFGASNIIPSIHQELPSGNYDNTPKSGYYFNDSNRIEQRAYDNNGRLVSSTVVDNATPGMVDEALRNYSTSSSTTSGSKPTKSKAAATAEHKQAIANRVVRRPSAAQTTPPVVEQESIKPETPAQPAVVTAQTTTPATSSQPVKVENPPVQNNSQSNAPAKSSAPIPITIPTDSLQTNYPTNLSLPESGLKAPQYQQVKTNPQAATNNAPPGSNLSKIPQDSPYHPSNIIPKFNTLNPNNIQAIKAAVQKGYNANNVNFSNKINVAGYAVNSSYVQHLMNPINSPFHKNGQVLEVSASKIFQLRGTDTVNFGAIVEVFKYAFGDNVRIHGGDNFPGNLSVKKSNLTFKLVNIDEVMAGGKPIYKLSVKGK